MNRRRFIAIVGTGAVTGLAGCVSELGTDDNDENGDDDNSGENETDGEEHGAVLAVESYIAAAADGDLEAMSDAMHTHHPFDPLEMSEAAKDDENTDFTLESDQIDDYEVELVDAEYEPDDVYEIPYVEFWFQDVDLETVLEGEEAALVAVETEMVEDGETILEEETFVSLTDDGEWTVFVQYEAPPEIPDDDPVEDEAYRIVENLEFDEAAERVEVHFERDLGIDVEEVNIYSTSLERENTGYGSDDVDGLPITMLTLPFDPEGDEIVVTALVDDEELVVHREEYEP
ncbi:hypothetical protein RBH26_11525 [Natronolimnohabitans sp. A-GB9]|uniref:hypothetical protein n=1 Tax=Natronolimnohabitans sp. A-GB9 TaxID=3069757 RepID=UPI0027B46D60|nr:hypothetical protein [Natronolimnohabitans sp. A-GB9]MDQ2051111.1 hypothetical protein [Natronolimnohabitans sp. A-GB9]